MGGWVWVRAGSCCEEEREVIFYLGTHHPTWLNRIDVPLFVARQRLPKKKLPRAMGRWALDSGAFSELNQHGQWKTSVAQYAEEIDRFSQQIGLLDWAAPQDWMCEPFVVEKTGLTVLEHQYRTVESVIELRSCVQANVIPVLQGWTRDDYFRCIELYVSAGIRLSEEPVIGLGSVCRRQHTNEIHDLIKELAEAGLALHGFGVKITALRKTSKYLVSADSLSWSYHGRREPPLPECVGKHINCANCMTYALLWREKVLEAAA